MIYIPMADPRACALPVISHRASGPILRNLDQGCQRADDNKYGTVGLVLAHTASYMVEHAR